jgi:hypothetical protein
MVRKFLFAIAFLAAPAIASPALFGIEIGSDLAAAIPECEVDATGMYVEQDEAMCRRNPSLAIKKAWGAVEEDAQLPKRHPDYLRSVGVATVDGRVVSVSAATLGERYQDEVLAALRERFGKATSFETRTLVNGFGVRVHAKSAAWKLPGGVTLRFDGVTSSRDWGRISLETKAYASSVTEATRKYQGSMRP